MTISTDLFMAILAMDTYNRGYNPAINGLSDAIGTQIGNAALASASSSEESSVARNASFYAQSYTWNGQTVIAYRGTDQASPSWKNWTLGDVVKGWSGTLGIGTTQAKLAVEFYKSVLSGQSLQGADATLTALLAALPLAAPGREAAS